MFLIDKAAYVSEYLMCRFKKVLFKAFVIGMIFLINLPVHTAELSNDSEKLLDQLQSKIKMTLLTVSKIEQQAGRSIDNIHYNFTMPAIQESNIGLELDINDPTQGYIILSVSENSLANKLKLIVNDKILAVNGIEINEKSSEQVITLLQSLVPGDILELVVHKANRTNLNNTSQVINPLTKISTQISGRKLPEFTFSVGNSHVDDEVTTGLMDNGQCGHVNTLTSVPKGHGIDRVFVMNINGKGVIRPKTLRGAIRPTTNFRLTPGKHILKVYTLGESNKDKTTMEIAKTIEIDVAPNMTYYLGAARNKNRKNNQFIGPHWQPVIWKISTNNEHCRL